MYGGRAISEPLHIPHEKVSEWQARHSAGEGGAYGLPRVGKRRRQPSTHLCPKSQLMVAAQHADIIIRRENSAPGGTCRATNRPRRQSDTARRKVRGVSERLDTD